MSKKRFKKTQFQKYLNLVDRLKKKCKIVYESNKISARIGFILGPKKGLRLIVDGKKHGPFLDMQFYYSAPSDAFVYATKIDGTNIGFERSVGMYGDDTIAISQFNENFLTKVASPCNQEELIAAGRAYIRTELLEEGFKRAIYPSLPEEFNVRKRRCKK